MVGRIVSHFEIIQKIGEGGNGVVWKARDLNLPRFAALKFLSPHLADSEDARHRLRREAQAISILSHPNIETIYEVGESDGQVFLALEYLPGGSLRERIHGGAGQRPSLREAIGCALDVAEGLAHAHRHGIVHRDIKPANILCTEEGSVKITDFGLAQGFDSSVSSTVSFAGTIPYMSPEQVQSRALDHRTDIYSFGAMLFEMVTGQQPFPRENPAAILHSITHDPVPTLRKLRPDAPDELDRIVRRALAKEPEKRYQRLEEMSAALLRLPPDYLPAPASQDTLTLTSPTGHTQAPRRSHRLRPRWVAILTGFVLVLIVLGIRYWPWPQRCLLAPKLFPACQLPAMKHIGILPFENLAGDADDRALFAGLEQTVASELAQLGVLENSLCVHRIRTPAESSGLDLLISGTTARVGENLRVTAALSDPVTKLRLREISRDIDRRNLLSFQNELAGQFAGMAGVRLVPEMNMGGTAIWPAFEFYLRGLGYLGQGEIDTAIESLQSALAVDAYYVAAHASLGEAFRKRYSQTRERKWLDQAIAECQRAVEGEAQPAAAYGTLGMAYLETRQFDKAVEAFTRALKLDPLNTETRAKLADALGTLDRRDEARAVIWEGVRLRPECWLSHSEAGAFLYGQGDFADAEKEDFIALKLAPASASVLNMLGALYYQTDQLQKAREFLERSRRADPSDLVPANNLGALYYRLGCYADSARSYEEATNLGEKDSRVWGSFGEALLKAPNRKGQAPGVFKKAIELARQELAADPTNQEVRRMLANDYARTNDQKRARETIETALKQAPKDANVQFRAVLVYEMLQDRKLAVEALKTALAAGLLARICADPDLEDLRRDPQFAQLAPGGCPAPESPGPGGCPSAGPAPRK